MKHILLLSFVIALAGCKHTEFSQTLPSGVKVSASDTRFLLNTSAKIAASVNPTNGLITISVDAASTPANETIKAIAEGVAAGAVKGVKP